MRMPGAAAHPALNNKAQEIDNIAQYSAGTFSSIGNGGGAPSAERRPPFCRWRKNRRADFLNPYSRLPAPTSNRATSSSATSKNIRWKRRKSIDRTVGKSVAERFFAVNLRQTVKITIKKGTDQPQSQTVLMAKMQTYSQIAAQVGNSPQGRADSV